MLQPPQSYSMLRVDVFLLQRLGYRFLGFPADITNIVNLHFGNLHLLQLAQDLESLISPIALAPVTKEVAFDSNGPSLAIGIFSINALDPDLGFAMLRTFCWNGLDLEVRHDFLRLPLSARNMGIGKRLMQHWVQQYAIDLQDPIQFDNFTRHVFR